MSELRLGRRWQWLAAGLILLAASALGVPLIQRALPSTRPPVSRATDPLASRRAAAGAAAALPEKARLAADRFIEPGAAAHASYAGGNYQAALEHYDAALARNPRDPDAWSNKGQVLVRLNRVEEAIPCFTRAIDLVPDSWTYQFNLARARALLGRWEEAIAGYRRAADLFPNDYVTTFNLGLALHKSGDDAGAVDEFSKAIALAPGDPAFRVALGISYERLQKPAEAAAAYGEYLRLAPSAPDADKVREHIAALTSQTSPSPGSAARPAGPKPTGG